MKRNILLTLLSIIIIIILFSIFRTKDENIVSLYDPKFYFSNDKELKTENIVRNIYTFSKDETPLIYRGSLSTVNKDNSFYNICTLNKNGYKRMINGQVFSDIVVSPKYNDLFILVDNNLIYDDKKIDIYEKKFDYSFSTSGQKMLFSVGDTLFYKKRRIETVGEIYGNNLFFSSDGKSMFYSIIKDEKDGMRSYLCEYEMGILQNIPGRLDDIDVSPYRQEIAYSSKTSGTSFLEIKKDDEIIFNGNFLDVKNILFSPDGERFSCVIKDPIGQDEFYINSNLFKPDERLVLKTGFSNDSKHFYILTFDVQNNKKVLYIDNRRIIDGIDITDIELFGENYICRVKDAKGEYLLLNGERSSLYDRLPWFCFSDDRKTLLYAAGKKNSLNIFVNGKKQEKKYDQVSNILFSSVDNVFHFSALSNKQILNISLKVLWDKESYSDMLISKKIDDNTSLIISKKRFDQDKLASLIYKQSEEERKSKLFSSKYERILQLVDEQNSEESIALIDELLSMYPKDEKLLDLKARMFLVQGNTQGVIECYLTLMQISGNEIYLDRIVDIYWKDKQYKKIALLIQTLINDKNKISKRNINRALYACMYINDMPRLEMLLKEIRAARLKTDVMNFVNIYIAVKNSDIKKAKRLLENEDSRSNNPVFLSLKGIVLAYDDRLLESVHFLSKSLLIRHDDDVLLYRAEVFIRMGEFLKAANDIENISYLNKSRVLKERLAHVYYDATYYEKAESIIKNLIDRYPKDASYYNVLAWMKATCSDPAYRDGKEAVRLAKIAYKLRPDFKTKDTLAAAFAESGLFDEAILLLNEILRDTEQKYYKKMLKLYKNRMHFYDAPGKG